MTDVAERNLLAETPPSSSSGAGVPGTAVASSSERPLPPPYIEEDLRLLRRAIFGEAALLGRVIHRSELRRPASPVEPAGAAGQSGSGDRVDNARVWGRRERLQRPPDLDTKLDRDEFLLVIQSYIDLLNVSEQTGDDAMVSVALYRIGEMSLLLSAAEQLGVVA